MQKNASGGQGLFVFYGREPKRPPFVRRGGTFALRSFAPVPPFGRAAPSPRAPSCPPFGRRGGIFVPRSFVPVPPFGGEEGARGAADADFVI